MTPRALRFTETHFGRYVDASRGVGPPMRLCRAMISIIHARSLAMAIAWGAISVTGCGGNDASSGPPAAITTQILSDAAFDGDIEQTSPSTFTVTRGMSEDVQSIFAGIAPGALTEFRAFLDFPLTGPGGIPGNAMIESAFLDIQIDSLQPITATIPILIELVSFQPPILIDTDFDRTVQPALAYVQITPPFSQTDVGTNVSIDVTSLLVQAQQLQLPDFQVRIMEDLGPAIPVLIEIDDTIGGSRGTFAPLLTVTYF